MNQAQYDILIQVGAYAGVLILLLMGLSLVFRGFFWKYIKVRTSGGRLILIKVRTVLTDYFAIGRIEEGQLIYKFKKNEKRIVLSDKHRAVYRCMNINWIDVDESTNNVCSIDYGQIPGFDAIKWSNLLTRCLQAPAIMDNLQKIMLILICLCILLGLACAYLSFQSYNGVHALQIKLPEMLSATKQTITAAAGGI